MAFPLRGSYAYGVCLQEAPAHCMVGSRHLPKAGVVGKAMHCFDGSFPFLSLSFGVHPRREVSLRYTDGGFLLWSVFIALPQSPWDMA